MTAPDRDDLERVLGEMENIGCHWPQVSKLIAVARAAAEYVAWIERPRTDKEIESPHAAKGRHLYNTLRSALGALTATNQPSGSE